MAALGIVIQRARAIVIRAAIQAASIHAIIHVMYIVRSHAQIAVRIGVQWAVVKDVPVLAQAHVVHLVLEMPSLEVTVVLVVPVDVKAVVVGAHQLAREDVRVDVVLAVVVRVKEAAKADAPLHVLVVVTVAARELARQLVLVVVIVVVKEVAIQVVVALVKMVVKEVVRQVALAVRAVAMAHA